VNNYTKLIATNQETGEIYGDLEPKTRSKIYKGPRKYWRIMMLYDKALLLLGSKVGIQLMTHIKDEVNTKTYKMTLNATHIAEDFGSSREAVARNIKKLIDNSIVLKLRRGMYFINPDLFWSSDINDSKWQKLKQEFKNITAE